MEISNRAFKHRAFLTNNFDESSDGCPTRGPVERSTPPHNWSTDLFSVRLDNKLLVSATSVPTRGSSFYNDDPLCMLFNSLLRLFASTPKRLIFFRGVLKNPAQRQKINKNFSNTLQLCMFLLRLSYKAIHLSTLLKWCPVKNRLLFSANFLRIKRLSKTPHLSWKFTKLKSKVVIRKLHTARLLRTTKQLALGPGFSTDQRILKFDRRNLLTNRRSKAILFLLLSLGFLSDTGTPVSPHGLARTSSTRGFVAVLALGSTAVYSVLLKLLNRSIILRASSTFGFYLFS